MQKYHEIFNNCKDLGPFPSRPHRATFQKGRISTHTHTHTQSDTDTDLASKHIHGPGSGLAVLPLPWKMAARMPRLAEQDVELENGAELSQGKTSPPRQCVVLQCVLGCRGRFSPACCASAWPHPADVLGLKHVRPGLQRAHGCSWCGKGKCYQAERPGEANWIYLLGTSAWREDGQSWTRQIR